MPRPSIPRVALFCGWRSASNCRSGAIRQAQPGEAGASASRRREPAMSGGRTPARPVRSCWLASRRGRAGARPPWPGGTGRRPSSRLAVLGTQPRLCRGVARRGGQVAEPAGRESPGARADGRGSRGRRVEPACLARGRRVEPACLGGPAGRGRSGLAVLGGGADVLRSTRWL